MINTHSSKNRLLIAVLAGLPAAALFGWGSTAHAQYQVGGNGHALDANPQVGSGGYNGGGNNNARISQNALQTNIITGNVGGLNYFHGNTNGEFNPNVFAGPTATANSDHLNFVAGPTVGTGGTRTETSLGASPGVVSVYSPPNYVGTPPPGVNPVPSQNNTLLVPAPRIDPLSAVDDPREDPGHDLLSNPNTNVTATVGELTAVNQVDSSGNPSLFSSYSPLYGVRQMQSGNLEDSFYQSKFGSTTTNPNGTALQPSAIQKMRDELNAAPNQEDQAEQNKPVSGAIPVGQMPLNNTVGATDQAQPSAALNSGLKEQALPGGVNSGEGSQNDLKIPLSKQSAQLKELERRYAQNKDKLDAFQQTEHFNAMRKANAQGAAGNGTGADGNTVTPPPPGVLPPGGVGVPPGIAPVVTPDANNPKPKAILGNDSSAMDNKPMVITSLATGMPEGGFSNLMKAAEDKMRQGKFTEAVASYESAEQVAKNNPFVYLGRAFAELGSSYYAKADLDLRRAVLIDPAVLAGRYDMNGFLGQDHVSFVEKELNDISGHEKGARAFVLLAFVAHNTGNDALAGTDLDEASNRGGYAGLVDEMRKAWGIVAPAPAK